MQHQTLKMPAGWRGAKFVGAVAGALLLSMACTDEEQTVASGQPTLRFALGADGSLPTLLDVPFPSDVYLANGHIAEALPGLERIVPSRGNFIGHPLSEMDGFSRIALSHFYIDELGTKSDIYPGPKGAVIDVGSLPKGEVDCASGTSSVFLLDLEAPAESARIPCRAYFHTDSDRSVSHPNIAVGPAHGVLLKEGHRYATVVTSRLKDTLGRPIQSSEEWLRVRTDRSTPKRAIYAEAYAKVLERLVGVLGKDDIVGIAPFTTHKKSQELYALRETLEKLPVPELRWDEATIAPMGAVRFTSASPLPAGFAASLDDYFGVVPATAKLDSGNDDPDINLSVRAHDQILSVGTAVFEGTSFLDVPAGSTANAYDRLAFANFVRDASGAIVPSGKEKIWVTFSIPKAPMPEGGYPVLIYAHGLSDSRHVFAHLANTAAAKGWVLACIDSITFGARSRDPLRRKDVATDYEGAPGAKYKGPDGLADGDSKGAHQDSIDLFGAFYNLGAARDQLRQSSVDMAELVRILAAGPSLAHLSPTGAPIKVDGKRIAYWGNSLGAIEGTLFAATEPRVKNYVLSVVGGGLLTEIGAGSSDLNQLLTGGAALNFDLLGDFLSPSHPLVSVIQTIIEPGDPIIYAPHLVLDPREVLGQKLEPRNIVATEVVYDGTIPNEANEAFARAAGLGLATPNIGSNAEISDIKNIANNLWRVPLPEVPSTDGAIHDTPRQGGTAVVLQVSPGVHGAEFLRSTETRNAEIPYAQFSTGDPFKKFVNDRKLRVRNPYRALQAVATRFVEDGFAGKVPVVTGIPVPVRDSDDDGVLDAVDADSNDPHVQ